MSDSPENQLQALEQAQLSAVLGSIHQSNRFEIADWHYQSLVKGSATGNVFRLIGDGYDDGKPLSWSLILKFVPAPENDQTVSQVTFGDHTSRWNYWKRELHFYQSSLPDTLPSGLSVPRCFQIVEQPDGYWLWLEDVPDLYEGQWPISRFGLAARHLARFSGVYLAGADIPAYSWITQDKDLIRQWEKQVTNLDAWAQIGQLRNRHHLVRRGWPDEILIGMSHLWQERARFFEALEKLPKTLQHTDSGHRNLLARRGKGKHEETVAIDWALVGIGTIGEEIAPLVCATLMWFGIAATQVSELETVVFDGYIQGLRDAGWNGDPKLVRLGYVASASLRFGLLATWAPEIVTLDKNDQMNWEAMFGQPIEAIVDNYVELRRFVLALADEARSLMAIV
jgi:hypothetical protein